MNKAINLSLPEELLKVIDIAAKDEYASRSDFIREAVVQRLKGQRVVDEWSDAGEWETVVDFRSINPGGVAAKKVEAALKRLAKT